MTRINSAINVKKLTDEHLLAEHREIKRLPGCFLKARFSGALKKIPKYFCLGTGHVTFFLNKMKFTKERYLAIYEECIFRGFNIEYYGDNWNESFDDYHCFNDYTPTSDEYNLLVNRIVERINNSPKKNWHYMGRSITKKEAIDILIKN